MRILMTTLAISLFTACVVERDDAGTTSDDIATTSQALGGWLCSQQCSGGEYHFGGGDTVDEAYQNLQGCGPGGGTIECSRSTEKESAY